MGRVILTGPTEVRAGAQFTVSIVLVDPANLGAFDLDVVFDPQSVRALRAGFGPLLGSTGRTAGALGPVVDNAAGRVALGGYSHGGAAGASESGELARVTFRAQREGAAALGIERLVVADVSGIRVAAEARGLTVAVGKGSVVRDARTIYLPTTHR